MELDQKFNQVLEYIQEPGTDHSKGDKVICYLTFAPNQVFDIKSKLENWKALAKYKDWDLIYLSIATLLQSFATDNPSKESWQLFSKPQEKFELEDFFQDLGEGINDSGLIEKAILDLQQKHESDNVIIVITDLETLHPFSRFGPIEQRIYSYLKKPLLVLYPGQLTGSALQFLSFYPEDGNYRSKHF